MAMDQNAKACHSEPFNDNTYPCSILNTGFIPIVDTSNNVPLLILDWSMVLQMEADYHMQTMPILMSSMRNSTKECCWKGANCGRRPCYRALLSWRDARATALFLIFLPCSFHCALCYPIPGCRPHHRVLCAEAPKVPA
ncbi:unnamed protein product [Musa banksii]